MEVYGTGRMGVCLFVCVCLPFWRVLQRSWCKGRPNRKPPNFGEVPFFGVGFKARHKPRGSFHVHSFQENGHFKLGLPFL